MLKRFWIGGFLPLRSHHPEEIQYSKLGILSVDKSSGDKKDKEILQHSKCGLHHAECSLSVIFTEKSNLLGEMDLLCQAIQAAGPGPCVLGYGGIFKTDIRKVCRVAKVSGGIYP